jgi:uncharacterized protein YneF (UPF0154 family)
MKTILQIISVLLAIIAGIIAGAVIVFIASVILA